MYRAIVAAVLAAGLVRHGGPDSTVRIRGFAFQPSTVSVPVGARIVWTNEDDAPHTVAFADTAVGPGGALAGKGDSLIVRFLAPGRYAYTCARHPFMTGAVLVTPNPEVHTP